jgi:hypothetical protein
MRHLGKPLIEDLLQFTGCIVDGAVQVIGMGFDYQGIEACGAGFHHAAFVFGAGLLAVDITKVHFNASQFLGESPERGIDLRTDMGIDCVAVLDVLVADLNMHEAPFRERIPV